MESDNVEFKELLWDLLSAMERVDLDPIERLVIEETFLKPPSPPIRTGKRGQPSGGLSQSTISRMLKDELIKTVKLKKSKSTEYHSLHRGIKQYKKVLVRALAKIDEQLNYGGEDELPPTLWYLHPKHIGQV